MEKSTTDDLNVALTKILDLREVFKELSRTSHDGLAKKRREFAENAKDESENLTNAISDFGERILMKTGFLRRLCSEFTYFPYFMFRTANLSFKSMPNVRTS